MTNANSTTYGRNRFDATPVNADEWELSAPDGSAFTVAASADADAITLSKAIDAAFASGWFVTSLAIANATITVRDRSGLKIGSIAVRHGQVSRANNDR